MYYLVSVINMEARLPERHTSGNLGIDTMTRTI